MRTFQVGEISEKVVERKLTCSVKWVVQKYSVFETVQDSIEVIKNHRSFETRLLCSNWIQPQQKFRIYLPNIFTLICNKSEKCYTGQVRTCCHCCRFGKCIFCVRIQTHVCSHSCIERAMHLKKVVILCSLTNTE